VSDTDTDLKIGDFVSYFASLVLLACGLNNRFNQSMKLVHIQTLLAVAESGSIRAAAEALGKSQSALTKQLKQMEMEFGLSLFQRTSKGVVPTNDGLSLLSRARSIDAELTRFEQEVSHLRGEQSGNIRVSAAPLVAVKILPRAISRFQSFFPEIKIDISSDLFGDALQSIRDGQDDILIGPYANEQAQGDVDSEKLFEIDMAVITSKSAKHARSQSLRELADCFWIMLGDSAGKPRKRFREQFTQHGIEPPKTRLASESRLGLLALVEELDAVCTFPVPLLEEMGAAHNVVQIPIVEQLKPLTISMVTRAGKSLTPAGEKFADCIRHRAEIVSQEWSATSHSGS
jgi:DNA-binding transcriptional LysR family regulator